MNDAPPITGKLVKAEQLLVILWEPESRPSMRWLRTQTKAKSIPTIKIGRLVFFDPDLVRASLARKNLIRSRH